ncbi:uncharacterized protein LOC109258249 [Panthera pardus]|uniref:Uncharacterized protein LOC109258249 n=1 Tax=Panthera pardus TaxID=9691 RepID=A0A9W2W0U5_PANPR|nr:uncharacterized protein LOC109258249 [Panthera pardus]
MGTDTGRSAMATRRTGFITAAHGAFSPRLMGNRHRHLSQPGRGGAGKEQRALFTSGAPVHPALHGQLRPRTCWEPGTPGAARQGRARPPPLVPEAPSPRGRAGPATLSGPGSRPEPLTPDLLPHPPPPLPPFTEPRLAANLRVSSSREASLTPRPLMFRCGPKTQPQCRNRSVLFQVGLTLVSSMGHPLCPPPQSEGRPGDRSRIPETDSQRCAQGDTHLDLQSHLELQVHTVSEPKSVRTGLQGRRGLKQQRELIGRKRSRGGGGDPGSAFRLAAERWRATATWRTTLMTSSQVAPAFKAPSSNQGVLPRTRPDTTCAPLPGLSAGTD